MDNISNPEVDTLLHSSAKLPDISTLTKEYEKSGGAVAGRWRNDRTARARFMHWPGQSEDGRKHREQLDAEPLPWENASDTRIPLVDGIIRDLKTALLVAFSRAQLKVIPKRAEHVARANAVERMMKHFRQTRRREWRREAELAADYMLQEGVAAWQVCWDEQTAVERTRFALAQLDDFPNGAEIRAVILDPDLEEQAVALGQEMLGVSRKAARQLVRELRKTGEGEVQRPYVRYNGPAITARKYGQDVFWPASTTALDRARVVFVRDFLSEAELRENVLTDDWDEEWVDAAVANRGRVLTWDEEGGIFYRESGAGNVAFEDSRSELIEVVWAYYQQVTDDGLPERVCTVYCPHVTELDDGAVAFAKHGPVGYAHGKACFVEVQLEALSRRLTDSRGVPEISATWQYEVKTQADMLNDRASLEVNPTLLVPAKLGEKYRIGPGVKALQRVGQRMEYLEPPKGNPALAFKVVEMVERRAADYWGIPHEAILPAKWQARLQVMVDNFLASAEEMFAQVHQLAAQYLSQEDLAAIFGGPKAGEPVSPQMIAGEFDFHMVFDARDLDIEFTYKKLDAISRLAVPLDRAGTIDHAKLVSHIVNSIDSSLGEVLLGDPEGAAMKVREQVDQEVRGMALGNEPNYVELDPTAGMKLQFLQDIVGKNPKYQQALFGEQPDENFRGLMENYEKNLQQSIAQLGENMTAGRTGVKQLQ
jgi:hypothetical protein